MSVTPQPDVAEQTRVSDQSALSALAGSGSDLLNQGQNLFEKPRTTRDDEQSLGLPTTQIFEGDAQC